VDNYENNDKDYNKLMKYIRYTDIGACKRSYEITDKAPCLKSIKCYEKSTVNQCTIQFSGSQRYGNGCDTGRYGGFDHFGCVHESRAGTRAAARVPLHLRNSQSNDLGKVLFWNNKCLEEASV
jgi:hypothetical protein